MTVTRGMKVQDNQWIGQGPLSEVDGRSGKWPSLVLRIAVAQWTLLEPGFKEHHRGQTKSNQSNTCGTQSNTDCNQSDYGYGDCSYINYNYNLTIT